MSDSAETPRLGPLFHEYLASEGYRPSLEADEDGDSRIGFKREGVDLWLYVYERDRGYVSLHLNYDPPDPPAELRLLLEAANEVTMRMKLGKATVNPKGDGLRFQADLYLEDPERFARVLDRGLDVLFRTRNAFNEELCGRRLAT